MAHGVVADACERTRARLVRMRAQAQGCYADAYRELLPLYERARRQNLISEGCGRWLEHLSRHGASKLARVLPVARVSWQGQFNDAALAARLVALVRFDPVPPPPLTDAAGERPDVVSVSRLRSALSAAAPIDDQRFPGGPKHEHADSRGEAVARFRDSKVGAVDAPAMVHLRGMPGALLQSAEGCIDLAQATAEHGAFIFAVDDLERFRLSGSVAVVENREAFFAAERLQVHGLPARSFVLGNGRLSLRLRSWLAQQTSSAPAIELWHCGDYDAAGLCDYLGLRVAGANVRLFVPADLDQLLQRYGKPTLVIGNAELDGLRRRMPDRDVDAVCALLQAHGCGLEQELLLAAAQHGGPAAR